MKYTVDVNEDLEEIAEEAGPTVAAALPFPPGTNKQNPPESGFVDEPDVYEEVVIEETTAARKLREARIMSDMPNPTEKELESLEFNAVWNVIKSWDVNIPEFYEGYCGANGSHVVLITRAIKEARRAEEWDRKFAAEVGRNR